LKMGHSADSFFFSRKTKKFILQLLYSYPWHTLKSNLRIFFLQVGLFTCLKWV
jgi:hypothetical protein